MRANGKPAAVKIEAAAGKGVAVNGVTVNGVTVTDKGEGLAEAHSGELPHWRIDEETKATLDDDGGDDGYSRGAAAGDGNLEPATSEGRRHHSHTRAHAHKVFETRSYHRRQVPKP